MFRFKSTMFLQKPECLSMLWQLEGIPNHGMHLMSFGRRDLWKSLVNLVVLIFSSSPFGAGRRMSPGMSYATTTMELVLVNLIRWFEWELATGIGEEVDMDEAFGITVGKKNPLLLIA